MMPAARAQRRCSTPSIRRAVWRSVSMAVATCSPAMPTKASACRSAPAAVMPTIRTRGMAGSGATIATARRACICWDIGSSTAPRTDPFGYQAQWGGYTDQETGLLLLTYRYYNPATGRFVTRDPSGYNGGTNVYSYGGNSPATKNDPSGLEPTIDGCTKEQEALVRKHLNDVCQNRVWLISNFYLRLCLEQHCENIHVHCASANYQDCTGLLGQTPGHFGEWGTDIYICPLRFTDLDGLNRCFGQTILHEMIHTCGELGCEVDPQNQDPAYPGFPNSVDGTAQGPYGTFQVPYAIPYAPCPE